MKNKRFWLAFVVIAVYVVIYEWVFHGGVLISLYEATASVWRPEDDFAGVMQWMFLGQILFAFAFCWLYTCTRCDASIKSGACYGFIVGLMASATSLIYYSVLPITLSLTFAWIAGGLIESVIAGIILSRILPQS